MCTVKKVSKKFIAVFLASLLVFIALPFSSSAADDLPFDNEWSNVLICDEPSTGVQSVAGFSFVSDVVLSYDDILRSMVYIWNVEVDQYVFYRISEWVEMIEWVDFGGFSGYSLGGFVLFVNQSVSNVALGIYVSDYVIDIDHPTYICFGKWESTGVFFVHNGIYEFNLDGDLIRLTYFDFLPKNSYCMIFYQHFLGVFYLVCFDDLSDAYLGKDGRFFCQDFKMYRGTMQKINDNYYDVSKLTEVDDFPSNGFIVRFANFETINLHESDVTIIYEPDFLQAILSWLFVGVPVLLGFAGSVFSFLTGAVILPWVLIGVVVSLISFLIYKTKGFTRL